MCAPANELPEAAGHYPYAGDARSPSGLVDAAVVTAAGVNGEPTDGNKLPAPASRPYSSAMPASSSPAPTPAQFLATAAAGTRVVARYRIPGGFTDALGYLLSCDGRVCVIATRRGEVTVALAAVVAAKQVPEPPVRRPSSPDATTP